MDNIFFETPISKLSEEDKSICEGPLTEYECYEALKDMKNMKSPGSDGFTSEFYKTFWEDIKVFLSRRLINVM